ncbi:MAG: helix-turn-helix transcriptional regulator [Chloroflexota bacterium]
MRSSEDRSLRLTARQLEVLELVASGHSNREIASLLHVSENGVKAHIARLLVKYGVPNRAALVRVALPGSRDTDGSVPDLYALLHETLSEVIGGTATEVLLHRALLHASSHDPELAALARQSTESGAPLQWWTDGRRGMRYLRAVLRELWRLLIEITGPVVVARLERRGLVPDSVPRSGGRT